MPNHISFFTVLVSAAVSAGASYIASRISQHQQLQRTTENYKLALVSEIRALHNHLIRYEAVFNERVLAGTMTTAQVLKVLLQPGDMVVFANNASAIGLFRGQTALRVLRFYADVRILHGHAQVLSELASDSGHNLTSHEVRRHQAMLRHTRRRAHVLVKRLKRPSLPSVALAYLRRRMRRLGRALSSP